MVGKFMLACICIIIINQRAISFKINFTKCRQKPFRWWNVQYAQQCNYYNCINRVIFCCFISAKVAFTERVYFFRPKSKSSVKWLKNVAGHKENLETHPFTQLCVGQEAEWESEIKTRLWAFTLRRRAGGESTLGRC
jgi:hypothetical protein